MTPPESPRDRASVEAPTDNVDQKQGENDYVDKDHEMIWVLVGSKVSAQDLSLMQRNIKNENNDSEH